MQFVFSSKKKTILEIICISILIPVILSSCSSAKGVKYFKNIPDSVTNTISISEHKFVEPVIQINDLLNITVQTTDNKNSADVANATNEKKNSYVVDKNGMIEVPLVGRIKVEGMTSIQAKEQIRELASKYYVDPIVNVRFLNFYINVLGDVLRPGRYPISDEKTSIIDAISLAGDLNITARRNNVLLIRTEDGVKKFIRFNFNNTDLFKSPYYYLKSGDVVYAEPLPAKARTGTSDTSRDRFISLTATIVSLIAITFTLFR